MDQEYLSMFFMEQKERMNMPDEDIGAYASRLRGLESKNTRVTMNASTDAAESSTRHSVPVLRPADAAIYDAPHVSNNSQKRKGHPNVRSEERASSDHLDEAPRKKTRHTDNSRLPIVGPLTAGGQPDVTSRTNTSSQGQPVECQYPSSTERSGRSSPYEPDAVYTSHPPVSLPPHSSSLHSSAHRGSTQVVDRGKQRLQADLATRPPAKVEVHDENAGPAREGASDKQGLPTTRVAPIESPHPARALSKEQSVAEQGNCDGKPRRSNGTPEPSSRGDPDSSNVTTPGPSSSLASASESVTGAAGAGDKPEPLKRKKLSFLRQSASDAYLREMERLQNAPPPVKKPAKKSKKKQEAMRPAEFAKYVTTLWTESELRKRPEKSLFLRGARIFFGDSDNELATLTTRNKLEYLARHGATLVPTYDPEITTHIVTNVYKALLLKKVGLQSIRGIPDTIPILRWEWVLSGERNNTLGPWHNFPTYDDRVIFEPDIPEAERERILAERAAKKLAAAKSREKAAARKVDEDESDKDAEESKISEFTQERLRTTAGSTMRSELRAAASSAISPRRSSMEAYNGEARGTQPAITNNTASTSAATSHGGDDKADPLAEFYSAARAEREAELHKENDVPKQAGETAAAVGSKKTGAFQCDNVPDGKEKTCPNQDVIDVLTALKEIHKNKLTNADRFRVGSYSRAINAIAKHKKRIESYEEVFALPGVGSKTAEKVMEVIETGRLRRLEHEATEEMAIIARFQGIYGVGVKTAHQWLAAGCRTLDDLREGRHGVKLSTAQHIGLKHYDDINTRMPREEAQAIFNLIKPVALSIDSKLFVEIMGSFRRGKEDCGDIDVLITRSTEDGKSHKGVLHKLIKELHRRGVLTEDLTVPEDWDDLENVYRGLCQRSSSSPRRRIDFLTVPYKSRGAALIYYTGDDIFNRSMRLKANKMGYSLNQRGLYASVIRDPRDGRQKLNDGVIVASETEREIFDKLGVPWQEPYQRVRGA